MADPVNLVVSKLDEKIQPANDAAKTADDKAGDYETKAADAARRAEALGRQLSAERELTRIAEKAGAPAADRAAARRDAAETLSQWVDASDEAAGWALAAMEQRSLQAAFLARAAAITGLRARNAAAGAQREALKASLGDISITEEIRRVRNTAVVLLEPVEARLKGYISPIAADAEKMLTWLSDQFDAAKALYAVPAVVGASDVENRWNALNALVVEANAYIAKGIERALGARDRLQAISTGPNRITAGETLALTAAVAALPSPIPAAPTDEERDALAACVALMPDAMLADLGTYFIVQGELAGLLAYADNVVARRADIVAAEGLLIAVHEAVLVAAPAALADVPDAAAAIGKARHAVAGPGAILERATASLRFAHEL